MTHILTKRIFSSMVGILALAGILVMANVLAKMFYVRNDITADKMFSLSPGTLNLLKELPEDVTIRFYYSASMPSQNPFIRQYADRVKDLLREYENNSHGGLKVETFDPKPYSDEEEWAQKLGVAGNPLNPREPDQVFYFGLVVEALDRHQVIPVLAPDREQFLEYDLSRMIFQVIHPEKKTIGVISTLPVLGSEPPPMMMMMRQQQQAEQPWIFVNELRKTYNVCPVSTNDPVSLTGIDLLMVIHPRGLPESTLFAIDQYVLRGGRLLVFTDPACFVDNAGAAYGIPMPGNSNLNRLLAAWGAVMTENKVVFDLDNPTTVGNGRGGAEENFAWVSLSGSMFNQDEIISAPLNSMILPGAGSMKPAPGVTNTMVPLLLSSKNALEQDAMGAVAGRQTLMKNSEPLGVRLPMAVKLTGKFTTAFPAGLPEGPTGDVLKVSSAPNTVIIICDADMLANQFNFREINLFGQKLYQPFNNNIDFVMNAVDQLCGDNNLISLRSRAKFERPFTVVKELEQQAQKQWLSHENELVGKLQAVRTKLNELQAKKDESQRFIMSVEQKQQIEEFQKQQADITRKLREVMRNQRQGIEDLGFALKLLNMLVVPVLVCIAGIGLAYYRHYKVSHS